MSQGSPAHSRIRHKHRVLCFLPYSHMPQSCLHLMVLICTHMWDPGHTLHDLEATTGHLVAITVASPSAWAFSHLSGNMA